MESNKAYIPSQPSDNSKNKEHNNVSFSREKDLEKTEVLDLSALQDTSIIPTVSLEQYKKNKIKKKSLPGDDLNKLSRKKNNIKGKTMSSKSIEDINISKEEKPTVVGTLKVLEEDEMSLNTPDKVISKVDNKKNEHKKKVQKIKEKEDKKLFKGELTDKDITKIESQNVSFLQELFNSDKKNIEKDKKKAEKEEALQKKKQLKEEKEREKELRKQEKEDKRKKKEADGTDASNMKGLSQKGAQEEKKLKKQAERKRIKEEKDRIRQEKDEKRAAELKEKYEQRALDKKKKEEKRMLLLKERQKKNKKINKEKEQAREERREKALLIQKAKEEERQKERNERKTIEEKLKFWYENLSFVKDVRNRRELQRQTLLIDYESAQAVRSEEKIMYKYVAKNKETEKVESGYFSAFSKLDVLSFLIAEGYEVYEISPSKGFGRGLKIFLPKFKANDLDFFLTQLSTFLKSGITLVDSIKILSKQCKNRGQQQVYKSIIYELTMGENFSEALSKQGTAFPKLLVNMVKTSELTGDLPETLDDMANYYKETEKTRKQMLSAITYPTVILLFALTILVFILVVVIPQFVTIYGDMGADLPSITVVVINVSSFLQANWQFVILGVIGFIVLFIIMFKSIKVFRTIIQTLLMNMPVFGKIIIYNEITMFTKTFASLLNHNVYITDAMEVLSKITNNEVYKMLIFDTITNLAKGDAISNSFKHHWAFPTIAYEMILTGEKTGQLGNMMDKVADYYQTQHKNAVNQIKAFIEPIMIVGLAVVVGIILLSVVLPMFDMYQNIG